MTSFEVHEAPFTSERVKSWSKSDERLGNWPVVYTLDGSRHLYVGESLNVATRLRQHLDRGVMTGLERARVIVDDTFNKSVCLDLESFLIRLFAGDGKYEVLNGNEGITDADYYSREQYQEAFREIFDTLRSEGLFSQGIEEIENSNLYKLSPFKALSEDQFAVVLDIVEGLFTDISDEAASSIVVQGAPGTGKTIVAIFLIKLLCDIKSFDPRVPRSEDTVLEEFFTEEYSEALRGFRVALVVPQQSLRKTIKTVFKQTPGLEQAMVLSAFDIGEDPGRFDLLIVDEAHRLTQRATQGSGVNNAKYSKITRELFGFDDLTKTQLDWIKAKSDYQLFLLDREQTVRPADVPEATVRNLVDTAKAGQRHLTLESQHRVKAGADYAGYIRKVLSGVAAEPQDFGEYDLRFYDDFSAMRQDIRARDSETGLARLVAGYAWEWVSKKKEHRELYDINLDGEQIRWNTDDVDWVNSETSAEEMGSIHTIQGYDLNYAGVVIGPDLWFDNSTGRIRFDRKRYFDRNGKANNNQLGITYSDDQLLSYVRNIYRVLLTRGIRGTYVYVCDPALREYLRPYFAESASRRG